VVFDEFIKQVCACISIPSPVEWGRLPVVSNIRSLVKVANAPVGTQAAQFDIRAAHRCIPVAQEHIPYLAVSLLDPLTNTNEIFLHRVMPFSLRTGVSAFGSVFDASLEIISKKLSIDYIAQWGDDAVPFRVPIPGSKGSPSYSIDFTQIKHEFQILGWPLAVEKLREFSFCVSYIGFDWNLAQRTVSLPEDKLANFLGLLVKWLERAAGEGVTKGETDNVIGTLTTATTIILPGLAYLNNLRVFLSTFPLGDQSSRHPPPECIEDAQMWEQLYQGTIFPNSRSLRKLEPLGLDIWVSSSNMGVAILIGYSWRAWRTTAAFRFSGLTTTNSVWAESIAIELAIHHIAYSNYEQARMKIHSCDLSSIAQYRKGWSRSPLINGCVRRAALLMAKRHLEVEFEVIPRAEESLAYGILNGIGLENERRLEKTFDPTDLEEFLIEQ
jgi:hypothetical protein